MCLTETAIVVTTEEGRALVRLAGRNRELVNLLVPDAHPGDAVLVGMGHVLGRATPAQVADSAVAALAASTTPQETPR
jgi:HupF/HypC family protein